MELCPDDEEASCFFMFFFLQRLPAWLSIQLEGDDQDDIRRLATKADHLFALHGHKHSGAVAVMESHEEEDEAVDINQVQGSLHPLPCHWGWLPTTCLACWRGGGGVD